MLTTIRQIKPIYQKSQWPVLAIVGFTLIAGWVLGGRASLRWLFLLAGVGGALILLRRPVIGLFLLISAALVAPLRIGTGTEVDLYPTALIVPALLGFWFLLLLLRQRELVWSASHVNRPLLLFLGAGLVSLAIGTVTWDPAVPKPGHFLLVQLAQWAIFALSAGAFWLAGNWLRDEADLRRLTFFFLGLAGVLALIKLFVTDNFFDITNSGALIRAPFWLLLFAIAGGQLLFNQNLSKGWRIFLLLSVTATLIYAFGQHDERASNWVGITAAAGLLLWFRFPRLRWLALLVVVLLIASGVLLPLLYEFAGGDERWFESGGARQTLILRVLEVTWRNPITGLGPAAYRFYAAMEPLIYEHIVWVQPRISSHNNYIDLFSHVGLLGLSLLFWFVWELAKLGLELRARFTTGFAAGYVNGALSAGIGALTIMLLADWVLPYVYNIQFLGFQASVLLWLFWGGLLTLERVAKDTPFSAIDPPSPSR